MKPLLRLAPLVLLMLVVLTPLACDTVATDEPEPIITVAGAWVFASASGWMEGTIVLTDNGRLEGTGAMTSSPLKGLWRDGLSPLRLEFDRTWPVGPGRLPDLPVGSWQFESLGGIISHGLHPQAVGGLLIPVRLRLSSGAVLIDELRGVLEADAQTIRALGQGDSFVLQRQFDVPLEPLSAAGIRTERTVTFDILVSLRPPESESAGRWQFTGTLSEDGGSIVGLLSNQFYGNVPVLFVRP